VNAAAALVATERGSKRTRFCQRSAAAPAVPHRARRSSVAEQPGTAACPELGNLGQSTSSDAAGTQVTGGIRRLSAG
jgi:hypothetical protein